MSASSCSRGTLSPTSLHLALTHSLRRPHPPFHSHTCWMTCWMPHKLHRSQFMGEMVLLLLICLLLHQFRLLALRLTSKHLHPHTIHFLLLTALHLRLLLHLHLLLHPCLVTLALSASEDPEISGCQSSGLYQIATNCLESPPTPAVESSDSDSDDPLDLIQAGAASTAEPTSYRQSQQRSDYKQAGSGTRPFTLC